jgi:hypothetical protein
MGLYANRCAGGGQITAVFTAVNVSFVQSAHKLRKNEFFESSIMSAKDAELSFEYKIA